MNDRSSLAEIRNPVLALPAASRIRELSPDARAILVEIMRDLARDARARAQKSWKQNKGPMAVYWKAVGAYACHLQRALRRPPESAAFPGATTPPTGDTP